MISGTAALGDVAEFINGAAFKPADWGDIGLPIIRIQNLTDKSKPFNRTLRKVQEKLVVKPGDLLVSWSATLDVFIWDREEDGLLNQHIFRVLPNTSKVDPVYLRFMLRGALDDMTSHLHGATMQHVNRGEFLGTRIPLPPLPEQRRIANILDRADSLRAQRHRAISLLDSLEDAIFVERFGDPVRKDDRWERVPLSALGTSRLGKMLDAKAQTGKNPQKYLRNANVQWFRFDLDQIMEMDFEPRIQEEYRLEVGDILICEGGQPGRSAIWRGAIEDCYFQKALHRLRLDKSKLLPEYFVRYMWLLSRDASFGGLVTSATIAHLTGEKLVTLPIVVPPMDMQRRYRDQTEAIDRIRQDQLGDLAKLDELFASLQHRAFQGEL